jgi:hypothetical protein
MIPRIYHRWEEWECYPAGFFEEHPPEGMTHEDCQQKYAEFLRDIPLFGSWAYKVIEQWPNSSEHNLTNATMNRIAWIGQSSVCLAYGIPAKYRGGYHLLTESEQLEADLMALEVINYWMFLRGHGAFTLQTIKSRTEANLY